MKLIRLLQINGINVPMIEDHEISNWYNERFDKFQNIQGLPFKNLFEGVPECIFHMSFGKDLYFNVEAAKRLTNVNETDRNTLQNIQKKQKQKQNETSELEIQQRTMKIGLCIFVCLFVFF